MTAIGAWVHLLLAVLVSALFMSCSGQETPPPTAVDPAPAIQVVEGDPCAYPETDFKSRAVWIHADGTETLMEYIVYSSTGFVLDEYERDGSKSRHIIEIYDEPVTGGVAHPGGPTTYYAKLYDSDGNAGDWIVGRPNEHRLTHSTADFLCGWPADQLRDTVYLGEDELDGIRVRKYRSQIVVEGFPAQDMTHWVSEEGILLRMETRDFDGTQFRVIYEDHGIENTIKVPEGVATP